MAAVIVTVEGIDPPLTIDGSDHDRLAAAVSRGTIPAEHE